MGTGFQATSAGHTAGEFVADLLIFWVHTWTWPKIVSAIDGDPRFHFFQTFKEGLTGGVAAPAAAAAAGLPPPCTEISLCTDVLGDVVGDAAGDAAEVVVVVEPCVEPVAAAALG